MRPLFACVLLMGLVACDDDSSDKGDTVSELTASDTGADPGDTDEGDTGDGGDGLTYYSDIAPLVQTHCERCHYAGGQGTGDFTEPANVAAMAEVMLGQIESGQMPPPVSDPDCRPYKGSEHLTMNEEEKALFSEWVELDKPMGEPASLVTVAPVLTVLEDPDLEVFIPAPYTPLYTDEANPSNEYRCFVIDPGQEETFYVTALAPILDQPDIIHHIVLFKKSYLEVTEEELAPEGYDCIGSGMADGITGLIAGWAPGGLPIVYEEGQGMPIVPTDRLVMQIHYFQGGPDAAGLSDQTGYAFQTAPSVETNVMMYPFGPTGFRIPADDGAYTDSFTVALPYAFDIIGTFPHMHQMGSGYHLYTEGDAGRQCLVESDQYDFDNQQMFMFEEPVHISFGDRLTMECTWDNSADNPDQMNDPPVDILYGERTDEEMCFGFTLVAY
jgi:hypothetical protein